MASALMGSGCVWVCAAAACLGACGPTRDEVADGGSSSQGDTQEPSSSSAADSSSGGEPAPDPVPLRLLALTETMVGGRALSFVEFGGDGELEARPLHPELDPALVVGAFEILTGTDHVAFIARPPEASLNGSLYLARADAGANGTSDAIDVGDDVVQIAWLRGAQTLVVATDTGTYRVPVTTDGIGAPEMIVGPATLAKLGAVDDAGMRIAADFSQGFAPATCFVTNVDPAAPSAWLDVADGSDPSCRVIGFGPDAVVFGTGDSNITALRRRGFVGGELQAAVLLAADVGGTAVVAPHGVIYEASDDAVVYVPVDGDVIGSPQQLSPAGGGLVVSADGRHLLFGEGGVEALVDLEHVEDGGLRLTLPAPYHGFGLHFAVSPDGAFAYTLASQDGDEYWQSKTSLWRLDISNGIAESPLKLTETRATDPDINSSAIEAVALAPDGGAIAFARYQPTLWAEAGDVGSVVLDGTATLDEVTLGDVLTSHVAYSPDGEMLAFGDDVAHVHARDGASLVSVPAIAWRWWDVSP